MGDLWTLRAFVTEDEGCIVSMWIRALWQREHPRWRREAGMREPSPEFWASYQPIVTALVRGADVVVACDPERVIYEPGIPSVLWGWACTDGDGLVVGFGIKNRIKGAGYGRDLARALLGGRLDRAQETMFHLPDLEELKLTPETWTRRVGWLDELLALSKRVTKHDALWNKVATFITDPARPQWLPGSQRAA